MNTIGCSASEYIEQINQPRGSYIPPGVLEVESLSKGVDTLNPEENVGPDLIISAVQYMARVKLGTPAEVVFRVPMFVARRLEGDAFVFKALDLIKTGIDDLDDESIINAVKLSAFGAPFFADPKSYESIEGINPDEATIQNVRTMVGHWLHFCDKYNAESPASDTFWDFEVSKSHSTEWQMFLSLMTWRRGLRLPHLWWFRGIRYLGIYNPRLDNLYRIPVDAIPKDVIAEVDRLL